MKHYSDFTKKYVQDICDVVNSSNLTRKTTKQGTAFIPDNFETLTDFLQHYVMWDAQMFVFLNQKGLVNRGICPYTGKAINNSAGWRFMDRMIHLSNEGQKMMQDEANLSRIKGAEDLHRSLHGREMTQSEKRALTSNNNINNRGCLFRLTIFFVKIGLVIFFLAVCFKHIFVKRK